MLIWLGFFLLIAVLLALDLGLTNRRDHVIGAKEALLQSLFYILIALIFAGGIFYFMGFQSGYEFVTGYLLEKSLSIDNIFVFVLIFNFFEVPQKYQHRVLFWGIIGALVLRGLLIWLGASLIAQFHWILYLFGIFLVITGIKMLFAADKTPDLQNNIIVSSMRKWFAVTPDYHQQHFFVKAQNRWFLTPLFLVLILIEISDIVFALDSIPAIFAVTHNTFIIFTSNIFAILGLRALYFALAAIIHRFHYLKYALSIILVIIGSKMLLNTWFDAKIISTELALLLTVLILAAAVILSMHKTRGLAVKEAAAPLTGWVPGSPKRPVKKISLPNDKS